MNFTNFSALRSKPNYVLVDMCWWSTQSKQRGIGIYLSHLIFNVIRKNRPLLFYFCTSPKESALEELRVRMLSSDCILIESDQLQNTKILQNALNKYSVSFALIGSPFEHEKSLLHQHCLLKKFYIPIVPVIHDLIPLEFPDQVFSKWKANYQNYYLNCLSIVRRSDLILTTGKAALKQCEKHLGINSYTYKVIPFGEKTDWIQIPLLAKKCGSLIKSHYVVSIAGGEWRKNVEGTIKLFRKAYPIDWKLVIICKLGIKDLIRFYLLSARCNVLTRVLLVGEVSDTVKWRYLLHAKHLLSLSFSEGLNIPVLEAKKAGIKAYTLRVLK